ncbi:MAG: tetratricopeptide repeat protein, partial [Candidatus Fibromonas sp.]|jgi:uncharacterized protein (TIGR02145 family)|nr:tetratricopeptide repeat protein [Candidatus Fibromonas sp.]
VTFELYNVSTEGLIDKFTETAKNFNGLRAIVEKRIPEGFKKIPGVSPVGGETSGTKNDAEAYYKRGVEYYEKKDYDKAISEFTEAIRLNPKYAEAYYIRGRMYILKEDYDIAISDLNEAIRLKRNYAEAYKMRGFTYRLKGDYDKAISDLNEAIRLNPKILSDLQNALENIRGGMFTDSRVGKKYKTIKIGSQTWMAENLNYAANGSKCYDNKPENCKKYGRLYDWATAKKVCPSGWHLPSKSEYEVLDKAVGGEEVAGKKLKAKSGWDSYQGKSGNGTDDFGFSALPGGCGYSNGSFDNVGYYGYWWSAGERRIYTYGRLMRPTCRAMWDDEEAGLLSVRCLQD